MKTLLVLHEASRTGAPRVGALIARELGDDTHAFVLKDGPLMPWIQQIVGSGRVMLAREGEFSHRKPMAQRILAAAEVLKELRPRIVYVNSVAASNFIVAARDLGIKVVLHVHERANDLTNLLRHDLVKHGVVNLADTVVLAGAGLLSDIEEVFSYVPSRWFDFGICLDFAEIGEMGARQPTRAVNAAGIELDWGRRPVVGMCGHASKRKGCDIFFKVAAECPDLNFIWIGGWEDDVGADNIILDAYRRLNLPNFYTSGAVDNPFALISRLNLFYLSSREDPNPLVVSEALGLGTPVLCFSKTTAVTDTLGRSCIMCYGTPNVEDTVRVLNATDFAVLKSDEARASYRASVAVLDIKSKRNMLEQVLATVS